MEELLVKTSVWAYPSSGGDGSASIRCYLTKEEAEWTYENEYEPFAEDGIEKIETYEGSNVHKEAVKNRQNVQKEYYFKDKAEEVKNRFTESMSYYYYILTPEEEAEVGMKFLEVTEDYEEDEEE